MWNSAEKVETQWNSKLARKIIIALPIEIPTNQYAELVRSYCREQFVLKETFDLVQQQMESRKKPTRNGNTQIFAGLIKCADCGKSMRYCTNKKTYTYFNCSSYSSYGKEICSQHYIRYGTLYPYILSRIQFWTRLAETQEEALLKKPVDNDAKNSDAVMKNSASELTKAKSEKPRLTDFSLKCMKIG